MQKTLHIILGLTFFLVISLFSEMPQAPWLAHADSPSDSVALKKYFIDNFDGSVLKKEWEVISPNEDQSIVEDGTLLILSTKAGSLKSENIENLLRLTKPMPEGDWVITAKFTIEYQTFKEHFRIGLYDNKDNWIIAESYINTACCDISVIYIRARKAAKGETKSFTRNIASTGVKWDRNFAAARSKPQYLQLRKQGRSYTVFAKLEGQENWLEMEKLTALRAKGNLILGFSQYKNVSGESFAKIDWVKIEVPSKGSGKKPKVLY